MIQNVAIVSLSSGIMGEESARFEVEIGLRILRASELLPALYQGQSATSPF